MSPPVMPLDTPTRIELLDPLVLERMRQMSPAEKLARASAMNTAAKHMLRSLIRGMHPDWDDHQVHQELLRRVLGGTA